MYLSSLQTRRFCLALPGEDRIPFVPWMLPWYLSLDVAVPLVVVLAPDLNSLRRVFQSMVLQTLIASLAYIAVPQTLCFEGHEQGGVWENLAQLTGTANLGWHADAPSLHVSFACTLAWYLGQSNALGQRRGFDWAWWIWAIGVAVSTVLVHEHHVVDVLTGLVLGLVVCVWESFRQNRSS